MDSTVEAETDNLSLRAILIYIAMYSLHIFQDSQGLIIGKLKQTNKKTSRG